MWLTQNGTLFRPTLDWYGHGHAEKNGIVKGDRFSPQTRARSAPKTANACKNVLRSLNCALGPPAPLCFSIGATVNIRLGPGKRSDPCRISSQSSQTPSPTPTLVRPAQPRKSLLAPFKTDQTPLFFCVQACHFPF